jgi:hypothetical protein
MEDGINFLGWLRQYIKTEFPNCSEAPDHLREALEQANPDLLPLFGGSQAAWAEANGRELPPIGEWQWPEKWREATKASNEPVDYDAQFNLKPETKHGPQGGKYTEGKTKDGRPYRRYF